MPDASAAAARATASFRHTPIPPVQPRTCCARLIQPFLLERPPRNAPVPPAPTPCGAVPLAANAEREHPARQPYFRPRTTGMSNLRIFLRSVLGLSASRCAALIWLRVVPATVAAYR